MKKATNELLALVDHLAARRKEEILTHASDYPTAGTVYYVSNNGSDENDGLSAQTPVATIAKVNELPLTAGDAVLFERGGLWRGHISAKTAGVTYSAYGEGAKPTISGSSESGAGAEKWQPVDGAANLYVYYRPMADVGGIVFDGGKFAGTKLVPAYRNGFVVREGEADRPFDMAKDFTCDLSFFSKIDNEIWEGRPVIAHAQNVGPLYLRCDRGNPGEVFGGLEFIERGHTVAVGADNVTIDNLHLTFCGTHSVGSGNRTGLTVRHCEIGWGGGCVQFYNPNGNVTRFGNGIEICVGCRDFKVEGNWIYQIYDAGVTNQFKGHSDTTCRHENVRFCDNLIEYCIYSIEYFLEQDDNEDQIMRDVRYSNNICRFCGYGWGSFPSRASHIKGWDHRNISDGFVIENNIFDRSRSMMIHCGVQELRHAPVMNGNLYIQLSLPGRTLGRYGERGGKSFGHFDARLPYDEETLRSIVHESGDCYVTDVEPSLPGCWPSGM